MKTAAIAIGIIFGGFFSFIFLGETLEGLHRGRGFVLPSITGILALIAGPFSLFLATMVGLKFARVAGYWLLAGGFLFVVLVALLNKLPMVLASCVFIALPMWTAGGLWLRHASSAHARTA